MRVAAFTAVNGPEGRGHDALDIPFALRAKERKRFHFDIDIGLSDSACCREEHCAAGHDIIDEGDSPHEKLGGVGEGFVLAKRRGAFGAELKRRFCERFDAAEKGTDFASESGFAKGVCDFKRRPQGALDAKRTSRCGDENDIRS